MNYSNLISASISEDEINEILAAIERINSLLPNLVSLSKEQLSSLPKVSYKNVDFIHEVLVMAKENPELVPSSIDIPEIKKDMQLIKSISKILMPLKQLEKKLEDSVLLAGSEAYVPSLAIYNSIRTRKNKTSLEKVTA